MIALGSHKINTRRDHIMTRPASSVLIATAAAALLTGLAPAAAAAAEPPAPAAGSAPAPVFTGAAIASGDLTGDGVPDRLRLGSLGDPAAPTSCAVQITPGLGRGQFGTPTVVTLPVRDTSVPKYREGCPDLGVVLPGPVPGAARLAVTWFGVPPQGAPSVQLFAVTGGTATYAGGFTGMYQPSSIGTRDLDGDGYGDVYEQTDQGPGLDVFVGRGTTWHRLYESPGRLASVQFFDFNHNRGTDMLITYTGLGHEGVVAVDGLTGATATLLDGGPDDYTTRYAAAVVDEDHNAYPDVQVQTLDYDTGTVTATEVFRNLSFHGRWVFVPVTS